ncbi:MAG TPA: aminoglycoside adenylyltransferase domain-containing protein [Candidatus Angelobacter sp.]|nr:aminoglycoside adenylyltransferase domain-containing protein [Candidatus Angelobacter sp.]
MKDYREGLLTSLGNNLAGAYLHGSIAFPEFEPGAGDIDFYVVIRRSLNGREIKGLDGLHRALAKRFELGSKLDGFYIPYASARRRESPRGLVYGAHGKVLRGGSDDAWAIHREHFVRSSYIRLYGPSASSIFSRPRWGEVRSALYRQLVYARSIIDSDPWWSVLNLCRLVYDFKTGGIVVSKLGAARWGLKRLPSRWKPVIKSAIKTYKGIANRNDRKILKRDARKFLGFASVRVIAFDIALGSRRKRTAHLRRSRMERRR